MRARYLYESVSYQQNEYLTADVDNIIRIDDWSIRGFGEHEAPKSRVRSRRLIESWSLNDFNVPRHELEIKFNYALESCLCSSYGVVSEQGGLDIDDGHYVGSAKPISEVQPADVAALDWRDFDHLDAYCSHEALRGGASEALYTTVHRPGEQPWKGKNQRAVELSNRCDKLKTMVRHLRTHWRAPWCDYEPWLLTISTSKRLRYTMPQHSPVELFSLLTFSAPAFLFSFVNGAVCHAPHVVAHKILKQRSQRSSSNGSQNA